MHELVLLSSSYDYGGLSADAITGCTVHAVAIDCH